MDCYLMTLVIKNVMLFMLEYLVVTKKRMVIWDRQVQFLIDSNDDLQNVLVLAVFNEYKKRVLERSGIEW